MEAYQSLTPSSPENLSPNYGVAEISQSNENMSCKSYGRDPRKPSISKSIANAVLILLKNTYKSLQRFGSWRYFLMNLNFIFKDQLEDKKIGRIK